MTVYLSHAKKAGAMGMQTEQVVVASPLLSCLLAQLYMPACANDIGIANRHTRPKAPHQLFDTCNRFHCHHSYPECHASIWSKI